MFSNRNLGVANVVTFFVYAGLYGMFFYVPIYVQSALGASATIAASIFIPITLLLFFLSPYAGRLNDRYGPRWLMCFGPLVAAGGIVLSAQAGEGQLWTLLVPGIVVFGIGLGFTVAPVTATAIGAAEERYSGVASGFNNGVSRVAGLIAIALMGVIVVQLWQFGLSAASEDADPQVAQAMESVQNMAFVTPGTEELDEASAGEVERIADEASETAFRWGMLLAALLVATGGVVSAVGIRTEKAADDEIS
jgi:MFS family permease